MRKFGDRLEKVSLIEGDEHYYYHVNYTARRKTGIRLTERFGEISFDKKQSTWQKCYDFRVVDGLMSRNNSKIFSIFASSSLIWTTLHL